MPLYNDLEVRPRYGSALPSYTPEGVRLEAPPVDMNQIIGEAALSGALSSIPLAPTYEGLRAGAPDPLAAGRGRYAAAFASDNPYVALTYSGRKGKVYPLRIDPKGLTENIPLPTAGPPEPWFGPKGELLHSGFDEFIDDPRPLSYYTETVPRDYKNFPRVFGQRGQNLPTGFGYLESGLSPGHAKVVRNVVDKNPWGFDLDQPKNPLNAAELPSESWAYSPGTRTIPAGNPLSWEDLDDLGRRATTITSDPTDAVNTVINDPRFAPGEGRLLFRGLTPEPSLSQRAVRTLKSAGKGLLKGLTPAALLEGALLAGPISGLAGGAGYASAAPESAGLFTPPGSGYEGLVTPEDIEAAAEARELLKEQERQRLLEQYRASGYDLDPNTRLRDLR